MCTEGEKERNSIQTERNRQLMRHNNRAAQNIVPRRRRDSYVNYKPFVKFVEDTKIVSMWTSTALPLAGAHLASSLSRAARSSGSQLLPTLLVFKNFSNCASLIAATLGFAH